MPKRAGYSKEPFLTLIEPGENQVLNRISPWHNEDLSYWIIILIANTYLLFLGNQFSVV